MRKIKITFRKVVNGVTIDGGKSIIIDFIQRGRTGDKGEQGLQGIRGEKGDQGIQGLQGIQGIEGVKGEKGTQGIPGEKGEKGDKGERGDSGAKGDKGDKGEGLDWSTMTPEERLLLKGEKGEQGIQGIQGAKGDKGDPGVQGERGYTGYSGSTGAQGLKGDKGDKGDVGDTGVFDPLATISSLTTSNKTVPGAINELNSGKAKSDLSNVTITKSMSGNGYYKAADGLMVQWGSGNTTVYFPNYFTSVYQVVASVNYTGETNLIHTIRAVNATTSRFSVMGNYAAQGGGVGPSNPQVSYIAVGTWK